MKIVLFENSLKMLKLNNEKWDRTAGNNVKKNER